jgi:hypothetical protein
MDDEKNVHEAGEGLTDEQLRDEVASQTSTDLKHADVFEREARGASTDTEAAKASADELAGD